ncbi:MAG: group I intron-associated PD-(D/E)XK endonuclease, partial [Actinomycetota bacterium]
MNPSQIGERTEVAVLGALVRAGESVFRPHSDRHRYDLAFERDGRLVKVQCKTGRERNGVVVFYTCNTTRSGERRDYRNDVDLFGVYCETRDEVYLIPVGDLPLRRAHLRVAPPRNRQNAGIREAARYLVRDGRLPD